MPELHARSRAGTTQATFASTVPAITRNDDIVVYRPREGIFSGHV